MTYGGIARALGRTTRAVMRWCHTHGHYPTRMHLLTTAELAEEWGVSVQYVARLARQGRIPGARRVPNGRTWLYDPAHIPERALLR